MITRCPECGGMAEKANVLLPVSAFVPPPVQAEPYVKITSWFCMHDVRHHGTVSEPSE
jgi:hypothetical protein